MQTVKGKSVKTVDEYFTDLRTFFRFIKVSKDIASPAEEFENIKVDDVDIFKGQICLNNVDMVQYRNMNFVGNLRFLDTQGSEDPYYSGFGERWVLVYVQ